MSKPKLARALAEFDRVNAADPRTELVDGRTHPRELLYATRMTEALERFAPDASEPLQLAVRAQHIGRWTIPRTDYPEGRAGYKRWRTRLMEYHAEVASGILRDLGYDEVVIGRVATLLRKQGLKRDDEVQTLEDVVCHVFLVHYFAAFAAEHEEEKVLDIVRKTWAKMSDRGRARALELDLDAQSSRLVARALEP